MPAGNHIKSENSEHELSFFLVQLLDHPSFLDGVWLNTRR